MRASRVPTRYCSACSKEQLLQRTAYAAVAENDEAILRFNFEAGLRNKAYLSPENELIQKLKAALHSVNKLPGLLPLCAWCASCDARHYALEAGMPTVIFGAGTLADAHSSGEKIRISEIKSGMLAIVKFLSDDYKEDTSEYY